MQIFQTYSQNPGFSNVVYSLANTILTITRTFIANGTIDTQIFDLQDTINKYGEDNGCIGLGYKITEINVSAPMQWMETSRLTYIYRTQANTSYASFLKPNEAMGTGNTPGPEAPTTNTSLQGLYTVSSPAWIMSELGYISLFYIITPYIGCTLDECSLIYRSTIGAEIGNTYAHFVLNGNTFAYNTAPDSKSMKTFMRNYLPITFNGPNTVSANSTAIYTVTANTQANLYLTVSSGTINRLKCKSGQTITLNTAGLSSGEIIELSGGYKFYPNTSKIDITIT
jgi:hypothetical protein